jgi:hypothetical protein
MRFIGWASTHWSQALGAAQVGLFLNMGQCCCASSRLFVQAGIYDEFVARSAQVRGGSCCLLPAACCLLPAACCLLPVTCYLDLLPPVCYSHLLMQWRFGTRKHMMRISKYMLVVGHVQAAAARTMGAPTSGAEQGPQIDDIQFKKILEYVTSPVYPRVSTTRVSTHMYPCVSSHVCAACTLEDDGVSGKAWCVFLRTACNKSFFSAVLKTRRALWRVLWTVRAEREITWRVS